MTKTNNLREVVGIKDKKRKRTKMNLKAANRALINQIREPKIKLKMEQEAVEEVSSQDLRIKLKTTPS
jgi:hypothetical protein